MSYIPKELSIEIKALMKYFKSWSNFVRWVLYISNKYESEKEAFLNEINKENERIKKELEPQRKKS